MAKKQQKTKTFSIQGFDANAYKQTEAYVQAIDSFYQKAVQEFAQLASRLNVDPEKPFAFSDYPGTSAAVQKIVNELAAKMQAVIKNGSRKQWLYACQKNDEFLAAILDTTKIPKKKLEKYQNRNIEALDSFQKRKINGLDLSQRVWNYSNQLKGSMELGIDVALGEGKSAAELSKDLRKYLIDPDNLFRRVRDKRGNLVLSKRAAAFKPGQGTYRSSYKNAMRLTRSEINMAYKVSDQLRWQQLDFVVGYEIKLSNNHTLNGKPFVDICDKLVGRYPKSFKFKGWHPQCYSDDTEVMTNNGWKLFKDLLLSDYIMSLNPENRKPEYVRFIDYHKYYKEGEMIRFYNKSLDLLVTPDHRMIYLKKSNGEIAMDKQSAYYSQFNGGLYRSSEYKGEDIEAKQISRHVVPFDLYVQFMAYYLAEGSISWTRKNQLNIAQSKAKHPETYAKIELTLSQLPFKYTALKDRFYICDHDLCEYLKQFGKSANKFIPKAIKEASVRQINLFLDAYVSCDGHTRKTKSFIGNRGNSFSSQKSERVFFSSSDQMASDIGELLIKVGKRPSFYLDKVQGVEKEHHNGTYVGNKDLWRIRECHSITSTAFNKDIVQYSGYVYDVELEKNHIMYVRRNGKCVWGSNCRCLVVPILQDPDEFDNDELNELKSALNGKEYPKLASRNTITDVPDNFKEWIKENAERSKNWASQPYFIRDNFKGGIIDGGLAFDTMTIQKPTIKQPVSFKTPEDVINRTNEVGKDWFYRGFKRLEVERRTGINGATDRYGSIWLNRERLDYTKSGLSKLANGESISFEEADALSTFWHEITHCRNKGPVTNLTALQRSNMELANEYVARNTLPEFYSAMGAKEVPHSQLMQSRESTGYNQMVVNYDRLLSVLGVDKQKALSIVKDYLFNKPYSQQIDGLVEAIYSQKAKNSQGQLLGKIEIKRLIKNCSWYKTDMFEDMMVKEFGKK